MQEQELLMIKPQELRIGNIVRCFTDWDKKDFKEIIVKSINEKFVNDNIPFDKITYISLNNENGYKLLIEKYGFRSIGFGFKLNGFILSNMTCIRYNDISVYALHILQNVYFDIYRKELL